MRRLLPFLEQLRQDAVYGARSLWWSPAFSITAIGVLAIGIGATLAMLHLFNAAMFHRLAIRDAGSLVQFQPSLPFPAASFYRQHASTLAYIVAEKEDGVFVGDGLQAELATFVTDNYFADLAVNPSLGRLLDGRDADAPSQPAVVLGYRFWQRRFAANDAVIGQTIDVNGRSAQVVGVAPPDFNGLSSTRPSLFLSIASHRYLFTGSNITESFATRGTFMYGKLKSGLTAAAAESELSALTADLKIDHPDLFPGRASPKVQSLALPREAFIAMALVTVLVSLVLLTACANLGNVLLARGQAREAEIRTRLALGAGTMRIVRQLMVENLLLAILGSLAALVVGYVTARGLLVLGDAPSELRVATDWRIVTAGGVLAAVSALLFGLAPAIQAARQRSQRTHGRQILVGVQVAASCFLLVLTMWLVRSTERSLAVDVRFDYRHMLAIAPHLNTHNLTGAAARIKLEEIAARVQQHSAVSAIALSDSTDFSNRLPVSAGGLPPMNYYNVSTSYFPLMNLSVLKGRLFSDGETDVVVLSESAARAVFQNEEAIGKTIATRRFTAIRSSAGRKTGEMLIDQAQSETQRVVIGIVADSGLNRNSSVAEAYMPLTDDGIAAAGLIVRTQGDPSAVIRELRAAASSPGLAPETRLLRDDVERIGGPPPGALTGIVSLGASATVLAGFGIFGLVAFTVAQRTREIGIRMALGARPSQILKTLAARYAAGIAVGAIVGIALSVMFGLLIRSRVIGLDIQDPISYGAAVALLLGVAVLAILVPATRALRINPATALRCD
jgi:predicted permease